MSFFLFMPSYSQAHFSFTVTSDQRKYAGPGAYESLSYFRGVVEAVRNKGGGTFMISPGDIDPPAASKWTIQQVLGMNYMWYPVVGNHELPGNGSEVHYGSNMEWLRMYNYDANGSGMQPDIVNTGPSGCPETTYSFDYDNAHFVVVNDHCANDGDNVTDGDITEHLYNWLVSDLAATNKEHIFVIGHEPAYPQPDADNGRARHMEDSLNAYPANRDRFWTLLKKAGVVAYICGHTHNYSAVKIDGVWQLNSGHARGQGDIGAPSTFLLIHVNGDTVEFNAYRDIHDGVYDYIDIIHSGILASKNNPMR
jgi:hypothetical protein